MYHACVISKIKGDGYNFSLYNNPLLLFLKVEKVLIPQGTILRTRKILDSIHCREADFVISLGNYMTSEAQYTVIE